MQYALDQRLTPLDAHTHARDERALACLIHGPCMGRTRTLVMQVATVSRILFPLLHETTRTHAHTRFLFSLASSIETNTRHPTT